MVHATNLDENSTKNEEGEIIYHSPSQEPKEEFSRDIEQTERKFQDDSRMKMLLYCDKCEFMSEAKDILEEHIDTHRNDKLQSFPCDTCRLSFHKRHLLNRHIRQKHTQKERKYLCMSHGCNKGMDK